jgi:uncharacterized membrane protein
MPALWAIGFNMIVLAGLVFLPSRAVLVTSIATTLSLPLCLAPSVQARRQPQGCMLAPMYLTPTGVRHGSVDNAGG